MQEAKYSISHAEQIQQIRLTLSQMTWQCITPVALALAFLYCLFSVGHLFMLSEEIKVKMLVISLTTVLILVSLAAIKKYSSYSIQRLYTFNIIIFCAVLSNIIAHIFLAKDILLSTNLLLILFGLSFFILSSTLFFFMQFIAIASWVITVYPFANPGELLHFIFNIAATSLISIVFHKIRVHYYCQREQARILNEEKQQELQYQAMHDPLTGLANRRLLFKHLQQLINKRKGTDKLAVFYFDLNNFKVLNDKFGHKFGDEVLQKTAHRLTEIFPEKDTVARIGGDEFVTIIPSITDNNEIQNIRNTIDNLFARPMYIQQQKVQIKTSVGFAIFPDDAREARELIDSADQRMYQGKHNLKR